MSIKTSVYHFLCAYFHQDWTEESDSWEAVIKLFCSETKSSEVLKNLSEDLRSLAKESDNDALLEESLFRDYGCYFLPNSEGLSSRTWLNMVAEMIVS